MMVVGKPDDIGCVVRSLSAVFCYVRLHDVMESEDTIDFDGRVRVVVTSVRKRERVSHFRNKSCQLF